LTLTSSPPPGRRETAAVFALLLGAYGWFHQGGGWQQNARFDQIRAVVETGRLSVNAYVGYGHAPPAVGAPSLRTPLPEPFVPGAPLPALNTGDLALHDGLFYPNKPPGVTIVALPAYALLRLVAALAGVSPDGPRAVDVLGWLTALLSVGVLGALAGVVFQRLAGRLFPAAPPRVLLVSTLAFGLGTPMLPYATMLFDHVPVAAFLLLAFDAIVACRDGGARGWRLAGAGLAAGSAVVTNYAAVLAVVVLAVLVGVTLRPRRSILVFLVGGVPPALLLLAYHAACFGGPFTIANAGQATLFQDPAGARWLGVFALPDPALAGALLFGGYRGLFPAAPVAALGIVGAVLAWRRVPARRAEIAAGLGIFGAYLVMNASFNAWHGGFAFGPRYLVPAVAFLLLPLAPALQRAPRLGIAAIAVSIALNLGATAVNPMPPQDILRPWRDFLVPLARGVRLERPEGAYAGPVSANLAGMGAPDGGGSWSAFNVGEALAPSSWLSLVPLVAIEAAGWWLLLRGRRAGRNARREPRGRLQSPGRAS
jgi:hypothetical protein